MGEIRSHARCWTGERYEHTCHEPSGRACVEKGCDEPAGTGWGPYWCPDHDVERLDRVSAGFRDIASALGIQERRQRMKVIWKFTLNPGLGGRCTLSMPRVREHLSVGMQAETIVAWALVDPSQETEDVSFAIVGTGWDAPDGVHRGTVQTNGGFVWRLWSFGSLRSQHVTVFVDERDGRGWQVYERIDLDELAKAVSNGD